MSRTPEKLPAVHVGVPHPAAFLKFQGNYDAVPEDAWAEWARAVAQAAQNILASAYDTVGNKVAIGHPDGTYVIKSIFDFDIKTQQLLRRGFYQSGKPN